MLTLSQKKCILAHMDRKDYNPDAVRRARLDAGFETQLEVAQRMKVTYKTISRIETGVKASYKILRDLASLYGASLKDWLYDTAKKN